MLPVLAEIDWLAFGTAIGGGLVTAAGILAAAIKYGVTKWAEFRREDRKHEAAMVEKFTTKVTEVQQQAAEDNREAFKSLVEIQRKTIESVAEATGTVRELANAVSELRRDLSEKPVEGRKRPRPRASE